jgi:hypothetical protein
MRLVAPTLAAVLAGIPRSQTSFTSPPNVGADGDSVVSSLQPVGPSVMGRRFQYVVGDVRDLPAAEGVKIDSIALRPDPAAPSSAGRSATLTIVLDHADFAGLSPTFAANYSGAETTFALGSVSLPATVGSSGFMVRFPLPEPYLYLGRHNAAAPARTALLVEFQTSGVTVGSPYSLDCADGTTAPVAGTSSYLGLLPCVVPPHAGGFDILRRGPSTSNGQTALGQYALRGPVSSFGVLALGLVDPDTDFGGLLCAPLRALPDVAIPVTSDTQGSVGSLAAPIEVTFPDLVPGQSLRLFTQFVLHDPGRSLPQLAVSLSDAIQFDVTPPAQVDRRTIYSTAHAAAAVGAVTEQFVPVMQFN